VAHHLQEFPHPREITLFGQVDGFLGQEVGGSAGFQPASSKQPGGCSARWSVFRACSAGALAGVF